MFDSPQIRSVAQSCPTLCDPMNRSTPSLPVHHQLPEFTQTHVHQVSVMPSSHLILCRPLLLLPSIPPSIRVISKYYTEFIIILYWVSHHSHTESHAWNSTFFTFFRAVSFIANTMKEKTVSLKKRISSLILQVDFILDKGKRKRSMGVLQCFQIIYLPVRWSFLICKAED